MTINLNLNALRNRTIDASVKLLNKARPKDPSIGELIDSALNNNDLTDEERTSLAETLQAALDHA